jgi:hypothetical protein
MKLALPTPVSRPSSLERRPCGIPREPKTLSKVAKVAWVKSGLLNQCAFSTLFLSLKRKLMYSQHFIFM